MVEQALGELWSDTELVQAARTSSVHALGSANGRLLANAVRDLTRDAWLVGWHAAGLQLDTAQKVSKTAAVPEPAHRPVAVASSTIDWGNWQPGDLHASSFAADPGLQKLLAQANVSIKGVIDTTLTDLSNRIAAGVAAGDPVDQIGRSLRDLVNGNSARAEMIAHTETCRVLTAATQSRYDQAGLSRWDWVLSAGACPICVEVSQNGPFAVGQPGPPAHPRCRCSIAPNTESLYTLPSDFEERVGAEVAANPSVAPGMAPEDAERAFLADATHLNQQLRGMVPVTTDTQRLAESLDGAIEAAEPSTRTVWGLHYDFAGDPALRERILAVVREGGTWEDDGFLVGRTSEAASRGAAVGHDETLHLTFSVDEGSQFLVGPDGEIILPRGTKIRFAASSKTDVIQGSVIRPKVEPIKAPEPVKAPKVPKTVPKVVAPAPESVEPFVSEVRTFEPVAGPVQDFAKLVPDDISSWAYGDQQRHDMSVTATVQEWLKTYLSQKLGWSAEERTAFKDYKGSGFKALNSMLRGLPWKSRKFDLTQLKAMNRAMREAMSRTSVKEPFAVYRGVLGMKLNVGDVFVDKGFTSTSFSPYAVEKSESFFNEHTGQLLRIVVPKGARGTSLVTFGKYKDEKEFLLDAGTEFRVVGRTGKYLDVEVVRQT